MKIGIFTNLHKDKDLSVTKKVIEAMNENSIDILLHESLSQYFTSYKCFDEIKKSNFSAMLTIGGDGTILRISKYCAVNNIPIIGINLGTLGFLTEVEIENINKVASLLKNNEYQIEKRSMLQIQTGNESFIALNEVVVSRLEERMVSLEVYVNNQLVDKHYCDGFIVSTPTGSTAYSLSAGGPIISPSCQTLALTPINSHSLHARALIVSDKDEVKLCLNEQKSSEASIILDGEKVTTLSAGNYLTVVNSKTQVSFIRFSNNNFYSKLLSKLNSWSITN